MKVRFNEFINESLNLNFLLIGKIKVFFFLKMTVIIAFLGQKYDLHRIKKVN